MRPRVLRLKWQLWRAGYLKPSALLLGARSFDLLVSFMRSDGVID